MQVRSGIEGGKQPDIRNMTRENCLIANIFFGETFYKFALIRTVTHEDNAKFQSPTFEFAQNVGEEQNVFLRDESSHADKAPFVLHAEDRACVRTFFFIIAGQGDLRSVWDDTHRPAVTVAAEHFAGRGVHCPYFITAVERFEDKAREKVRKKIIADVFNKILSVLAMESRDEGNAALFMQAQDISSYEEGRMAVDEVDVQFFQDFPRTAVEGGKGDLIAEPPFTPSTGYSRCGIVPLNAGTSTSTFISCETRWA